MESPFGRGPITPGVWGQKRSPWLLTTYPSPGMILRSYGPVAKTSRFQEAWSPLRWVEYNPLVLRSPVPGVRKGRFPVLGAFWFQRKWQTFFWGAINVDQVYMMPCFFLWGLCDVNIYIYLSLPIIIQEAGISRPTKTRHQPWNFGQWRDPENNAILYTPNDLSDVFPYITKQPIMGFFWSLLLSKFHIIF